MAFVPFAQYVKKNPFKLSAHMLRKIALTIPEEGIFIRISDRHVFVDEQRFEDWLRKNAYFTTFKKPRKTNKKTVDLSPAQTPVSASYSAGDVL